MRCQRGCSFVEAAISRLESELLRLAQSSNFDGVDVSSRIPQDRNSALIALAGGLRVRSRGLLLMCARLPGSTVEGMSLSVGISGRCRWAGEPTSDHGKTNRRSP
jgi:hypothetical protein